MSETDVRITDLNLLTFIDSGDFFAVVDTGTVNRTKKVEFDTISGQINDPLSGFVVAVSGEFQSDVDALSGYQQEISGRQNEISGRYDITSGMLDIISGRTDVVSGELDEISGHLTTVSGTVDTHNGNIQTINGNLTSLFTTTATTTTNLATTGSTLDSRMMYCIYAEESDTFTAGHEWSFGNGDETPAANGIPIVFASKLIGLGLDVERTADGDVTVEVYKDGVASTVTITAAGSATTATLNSLSYTFAAGTTINFKTTAAGGTTQSGRIVAYLRTT